MEELNSEQRQTLRFIHQAQRDESLGHRKSIFNAFSLSMAGLLVVLAGVVSADAMLPILKGVISFAVVVVGIMICSFIWQQRQESEKGMKIMRQIERQLGLYDVGRYISGQEVLPTELQGPTNMKLGITKGDWFQVIPLVLLALSIIVVVILLPCN